MICPKCEQGNIIEVIFKTGKRAFSCDFCESFWFKGELINPNICHKTSAFLREKEFDGLIPIKDRSIEIN